MERKELEAAVEAILFASGEPVRAERLCLALEMSREQIDALCGVLADRYRYDRCGLRLVKLGESYQLCSAPEHAPVIRKALEGRRPPKLSQTALEVLSIIAYFQPITRAYIDQIRGVDSAYTVGLLLERELIEEAGRLSVPGRPVLLRTTKTFLRSFGLSDLDGLPPLPDLSEEGEQTTLDLKAAIHRLEEEQELEAGTLPEQMP